MKMEFGVEADIKKALEFYERAADRDTLKQKVKCIFFIKMD